MLCKHTPAQAGSCSTGRGAIFYFAGSNLRQSVLAALRSVERLEAAIGETGHVSATIDLEKLMEGTPEMGSRQDRRKYILGCAKSLSASDSDHIGSEWNAPETGERPVPLCHQ